MTASGSKPIPELAIGDIVLAYDEETGGTALYPITDTMAHLDPIVVYLTINGELIETTPEHPFYELEIGPWLAAGQYQRCWADAGELEVVDLI